MNGWILLARKIKACTAERRWKKNPVWPSSCVTPTGTSKTTLMSRMNGKKTHTHPQQVSLIPPWEDQREWHRMTRMTRQAGLRGYVQYNKYTHYTHYMISQATYIYILIKEKLQKKSMEGMQMWSSNDKATGNRGMRTSSRETVHACLEIM